MNKQLKCCSGGKKKKEVTKMIKNGNDFRLITNYDTNGNILSIMEKPNLRNINPTILASGAHVFVNSEHNHCNFFQSGALVFKEYPKVKGSTNYGYTISGAILIV